jgi:acetyltransferase
MAPSGHDMFIGGLVDDSFGPVVVFGYGGIYVEVFKDTGRVLCPANHAEISYNVEALKSYAILKGARGQQTSDIDAYLDAIERISWLLQDFAEIKELDLNPVRILPAGAGCITLDGRARIA